MIFLGINFCNVNNLLSLVPKSYHDYCTSVFLMGFVFRVLIYIELLYGV